jgi:chromosome segregation ATPase
MKTFLFTIFFFAALAIAASAQDDAAAQVAQAKANEQRVRDNLRSVTQQLRTAEAEKATALAGQTERDQKIADLEAQVAKLAKRANEDKASADKSIADLNSAVVKGGQEIARLSTTLDKWKAAYNQAAGVAKTTEAARVRLDASNIALERTAAARERQNLSLYQTGREILQRYADFSLGRAIVAREPFTGLAKARLEEQVQDYADKLEDSKLKPVPGDGKPSTKPIPDKPEPPAKPAQRQSTSKTINN